MHSLTHEKDRMGEKKRFKQYQDTIEEWKRKYF